jgi:SsrA-binding protein
MSTIATNRRARFDYELLNKYEAGLVLSGQEVKSIKTGHLSLKGAFVTIKNNEAYLTNALIPLYQFASANLEYDPTQSRKLLLKKSELKSIIGKKSTEGLTLVPIRVYTKGRLIKLEFAVARGKKKYDKRKSIAQRESQRKINRALKNA